MKRCIYNNDADARGAALMELLCVVTVLTYLMLVVGWLVNETLSTFSQVVGWQ